MKIGVFSTNLSFFTPIEKAFKKKDHQVVFWTERGGDYDLGRILSWCEVAFVDFCQTPLDILINKIPNHPDVVLAARMHRIEVYNHLTKDRNVGWDKIDYLFVSAQHVMDRFMEFRRGASKPKNLILASTNVIDPSRFQFVDRVWKFPYRLCMIGNVIPKKRQYTAIQYMHDLRVEHGDIFKLDIVGRRNGLSGYGNFEYYQNCLDLIEDLGLENSVSFYDRIEHDEMPTFLAREHGIISNSNEEGTHVSIAEAAMTGCFPIVNAWRGSDEVYPSAIARRFRSPGEFVDICTEMKEKAEANEMPEISKGISNVVLEKYGDMGKYDRLVETLEGAVIERRIK